MKTLLKIDSSLRREHSYSRMLGDFFVQQWLQAHPEGLIITRDVATEFVPHLNQQTVVGFFNEEDQTELKTLSDTFIDELYRCNEVLITSPMYNFGIPSSLKSYFDLVVRVKKTFQYGEERAGLLAGRKAYVITAMGDKKARPTELSLVERHLFEILSYIGIKDISFFPLDGTTNAQYVDDIVKHQKKNITLSLKQLNYEPN